MRNKAIPSTLVSCLLWVTALPNLVQAQGHTPAAATSIDGIKRKIAESRTNPNAHLEVLLNDGRRISGRLGEVTDNGFTLMGGKTGTALKVAYQEVVAVRRKPRSRFVKFGLLALIAGTSALAITAVTVAGRN